MRKNLIIVLLFFKAMASSGQVILPPLENINLKDSVVSASYKQYVDTFNFAIFLKPFSNWGSGNTTALAYNKTGWYKIQINTGRIFMESTKKILVTDLNYDKGDSLFKILFENHLFDMQDERMKKLPCKGKIDTIVIKGKRQIVEENFIINDGNEYEFQIVNETKFKRLYFYAPEDYYHFCPDAIERKWIINCIKAFEKYLGM